MKRMNPITSSLGAALLMLTAQSSQAYVELTYTSQTIAWESASLFGEPDLELGTYYPPSFTLSFNSPDTLSSSAPTTFLMNNPQVSTDPSFFENILVAPSSKGSVTVNPDGTIANWNIFLALQENLTPGSFNFDRHVTIASNGGEGSCNCDRFNINGNLWLYRGWGYVLLGPIAITYGDKNNPDNWDITNPTKIPEPQTGLLILSGLAMSYFIRRKRVVA